jgi:hypothetical protein
MYAPAKRRRQNTALTRSAWIALITSKSARVIDSDGLIPQKGFSRPSDFATTTRQRLRPHVVFRNCTHQRHTSAVDDRNEARVASAGRQIALTGAARLRRCLDG